MKGKTLNKFCAQVTLWRTFAAFAVVFVLIVSNSWSGVVHALEPEERSELPADRFGLNSEAAILMDAATGKVLYEKNSKRLMYPASITKIVTGIIAIEQGNLDDIVTVSKNAREADGTRVYLLEGEEVPLLKLVQGLLINSGNDAGIAIAEHMDGSESRFAERMNHFVRETIGVQDTTFRNPHGLFDPEHQTTAYDMALITQYAMNNEQFRSIVGTEELEWIGEGWETTLHNHNLLLKRYEGTTGVKNGYVSQSGNTLVSSAKRGNTEWITVTLKADSAELAYEDTTTLFDYGFEHFRTHHVDIKADEFSAFSGRYRFPDKLVFTGKVNDTFTTTLDETSHELKVTNQEGETVHIEPLIITQPQTELADEEAAEKQTDSLYTEAVFSSLQGQAISSKLSTGFSFIGLIFILFLLLCFRKIVRQYRSKDQQLRK
ncbi:D-alanyl-D-alanine carboxypeptidase family protein [Paenibacillus senegalensis]|uniref:D-alanyl-D-alanine carboxypeptidase family protein n=1 Tax=Paenibacillus senegalensis TaxID=1465766 RepID=UPI00028896B0|nr:D-alanyl-D-alanine carboxypeptidase family protein [Paenibacillus senegalensis]